MSKQLSPGELDELETGIRNMRDAFAVIAEHSANVNLPLVIETAKLARGCADELLAVFK